MSKETGLIKPVVIYDSRHAIKVYVDKNFTRSANIIVPVGCVALIELTAPLDYVKTMMYSAIRTPEPSKWDECLLLDDNCIGKRYRRWKCCQSLGTDIPDSTDDDFTKSVVRWGYDQFTEEIVEFEFIDRPGNYYLVGRNCDTPNVGDCKNPTIFEVSIMPIQDAIQLNYPCFSACS